MLKRYTLVLMLLLLVGSLLFQSTAQSQDPTGTTTPAPTLIPGLPTEPYIIEAEDPIVIKEGEWDEFESTSASGNAYVASKRTGDQQLGLLFEGTRIEVIYARHEAFGTMSIEIDNKIVQTIDTQSDVAQFNVRAVVNELEPGFHIIRISADSGAIAIDGFEIVGTADVSQISLLDREAPHVQSVIEKAEIVGSLHIIITFHVPPSYQSEFDLANEELANQQRRNILLIRNTILQELSEYDVTVTTSSEWWALRFPFMGLHVTREAFQRLIELPYLISVKEAAFGSTSLTDSTAMIGADDVWSTMNIKGTGQTVVVIDNGIFSTHPFLSGKVIEQACFSIIDDAPLNSGEPGDPAQDGIFMESDCQNQATADFSATSAECPNSPTNCKHGTHVSGIVAGNNGPSYAVSGVAPEADVIAVKAVSTGWICDFDGNPSAPYDCGDPTHKNDWFAEAALLDAMSYVLSLVPIGNPSDIIALNLSLQISENPERGPTLSCDNVFSEFKMIVDEFRRGNVVTVVASGNNDSLNGVGSTIGTLAPACISTVVSVGASQGSGVNEVSRTDSHISQNVDLFAPGSDIDSSWDLTTLYSSEDGTSMAAPHVAGSWALIRQAYQNATIPQVLDALRQTGTPILRYDSQGNPVDYGQGQPFTWPRINVDCAIRWLDNPALASIAVDGDEGNDNSGDNGLNGVDISDDGRYIVFESTATNLVPNDTNLRRDVFVFDRRTCDVKRISETDGGIEGDLGSSSPSISGDGRYIVYSSYATNLDPERPDNNNQTDIFLHDRDTDGDGIYDEQGATRTQRITHPYGTEFDGESGWAHISRDGGVIVFRSWATNIVNDDTNDRPDIFVYDRDMDRDQIFDEPGATHFARVSVSSEGTETADGPHTHQMSISGDGQHIVFVSESDQGLDGEEIDYTHDVFVHNRDVSNNGTLYVKLKSHLSIPLKRLNVDAKACAQDALE
ncbi:MAG: S8 family serine peptidase [Chloroflexi bacterium]|nr:S8 family serine peptidase [Chloroflexota bacterium]